MAQINQQQKYLANNLRLQINVVGIANSKKMLFNDEGISSANWKTALEKGKEMNIEEFVKTIQTKNFRNSVFADVTANEVVATCYDQFFEKSISIVACNKIACSSPYDYTTKN